MCRVRDGGGCGDEPSSVESDVRESLAACRRFERMVVRMDGIGSGSVDSDLEVVDDPDSRSRAVARSLVRLAFSDRAEAGAALRWFRSGDRHPDELERLAMVAHLEWREAGADAPPRSVEKAG